MSRRFHDLRIGSVSVSRNAEEIKSINGGTKELHLMRLIHATRLEVQKFFDNETSKYAILSHH